MDIKEYKAAKNNLTESHHPWEHARVAFMHKLFKKNIGHYKIKNIQPVDMFPHTPHIENIVLMEKYE